MTEMDKLEEYLKENGYDYMRQELHGGQQIRVFNEKGKQIWDAVCHRLSYGGSRGLLEIMGKAITGLGKNDVEGFLTAEDVITKLEGVKMP